MSPQTERTELDRRGNVAGRTLFWLGGGRTVGTDAHAADRSHYQLAGAVVLLGGLLAWAVASAALAAGTDAAVLAILPFTLVFGVVVAAVSRAIAAGHRPSGPALIGRALVAVFVGVVVGELAATVLFGSAIGQALDRDAAQRAASSPAVVAAGDRLDRARADRTRLDDAVRDARTRVDQALVTARCEYNPSPGCPPQRITGDPGAGPEARDANAVLAGAQRELDLTTATRDGQAAGLDAEIRRDETALDSAKTAAPADVDRGLGARWTAMHDYTTGNAGAMLLRLATIAFFALLVALPLLLRFWRGETHQDRHDAAEAVRHRADQDSDTAIAVKRAQVRAEAENLWAEQQLAKARLAAEAQTVIDRQEQQQRVLASGAVVDAETPALEELSPSRELAAASDSAPARRSGPLGILPAVRVPNSIPELTDTVTSIVKPFVPSAVSKTIGNSMPFRSARTLIEEFDEVHFSFTRRRTVTHDAQESTPPPSQDDSVIEQSDDPDALRRITTTRLGSEPHGYTEIETSWDNSLEHNARPRELPSRE